MPDADTNRVKGASMFRHEAKLQIHDLARFPEENPNPVLRSGVDGTVLYANHAAQVLLENLGWTVGEKLPKVFQDPVFHTVSIASPVEFDLEVDSRDYSVAISPGPNKSDINLYLTDITARKKAERALRESREDLNRAQAVAQVGSWRLDVRRNELVWSDENHRIFGVQPGFPMTYETFLDKIHPDDLAFVKEKWAAALQGKPYDIEHRIIANGQLRWVRERSELEFDENGELRGGFGTTQDITQRKYTEQALHRLNETLEQQVEERTAAFQMLHDVTSMANLAQEVQDVLEYCLQRVAQQHDWDFGHAFFPANDDSDVLLPAYVWYSTNTELFREFRNLTLKISLRRGQSLAGSVYDKGKPKWINRVPDNLDARKVDLAKKMGIVTAAAFPVMIEQRVAGVLEFFSRKKIIATQSIYDSMISIGTQIGRVIERKAFQDRLLSLAEEEHRRIGQELHDDVGQELTGLALKVETLVEMLGKSDDPSYKLAKEVSNSLERTRRKSRALSRGLIPTEIDPAELKPTLEDLAIRTSESYEISCLFQSTGDLSVVPDHQTATQLYRITREAVANAISHAQAQKIEIKLAVKPNEIVLEVQDDGVGLPPKDQLGAGMGLQIMRYRASLIRGQLEIHSSATIGTKIICRVVDEVSL